MRVVIAGGSGLIGSALVKSFPDWQVTILSRSNLQPPRAEVLLWDGRSVGEWSQVLEGADLLINLAGVSVMSRWNRRGKEAILRSRVDATTALGNALSYVHNGPPCWINASAVGIYGDSGDVKLGEDAPCGTGFLAETCVAWELAQQQSCPSHIRAISLRMGMVLSRDGGALPKLQRLARVGLGGTVGSGMQWVAWIGMRDLSRLFRFCAGNSLISGAVNAVSPKPVRNRDLMRLVRNSVGRNLGVPVPKLALQVLSVVGPNVRIALQSQRAAPTRAQSEGFHFEYPTIQEAVAE